jgi:RNA-directed DNA polymerase
VASGLDRIPFRSESGLKVKPALDSYNLRLLNRQTGRCPLCRDPVLTAAQPPQAPQEWERWWHSGVRRAIAAKYLTHDKHDGSPNRNHTRVVHTY